MKPELIISFAALAFAGISVYLNILSRKKDFYNQLLWEQIAVGYQIMETLLKLNNAYTEWYKKFVGASLAWHLTKTGTTPEKGSDCFDDVHCYAIALHFVYYNFCKIHKSLSVTPAMQVGLMKRLMSIEDIANLAPIEAPKKWGVYQKKEKA